MKTFRGVLRYVADLLNELSDQSAYRRFLAGRGVAPSREQWRLFTEQRHGARFRRAKCC